MQAQVWAQVVGVITGTGLTHFRMGRTHTDFESEILSSPGLLQMILVKSGTNYKGGRIGRVLLWSGVVNRGSRDQLDSMTGS